MDASFPGTGGCHRNRHSCSTSHVMVAWSFKEQLVNPCNVSIDFRLENCVFSIGVCPCDTLTQALIFANFAIMFQPWLSLLRHHYFTVCKYQCVSSYAIKITTQLMLIDACRVSVLHEDWGGRHKLKEMGEWGILTSNYLKVVKVRLP